MRNSKFKRAVALFFSVVMLIGAFCVAPFNLGVSADDETDGEKLVSRHINVVYDDSNSMLMNNRLWWCYAKYSLEVFSAMMQDKDTMNIYFMSDKNKAPRISNLSGDRKQQQNNISTIHNTVTNTMGTPFSSIEKAYGDLKKTTGYDEKWLVVITDGDTFDNKETQSDIDSLIADCAANSIKVVYLAIGNALVPTENQSKGIFVYKADGQVSTGETGILSRVTQICQRIFQRPAIESTNSNKFVLDIPASEIIVFAQGANVSIGDLTGTKKTLSSVAMSASDKDKATTNSQYKNKINIDVLNASIATFTPQSGGYISEGTYELPISAEEYVIYYKPCLEVLLELQDDKGNTISEDYIPIGSYSLKYWLTYPKSHPKHGEAISQSLFDVEYSLTCDVDGNTRPLNSNNVDLSEGKTTIKVVAKYLNFISTDASLKYVVEDFTINELHLELEYLQQNYVLSSLEKDNKGLLVKVSKGGEPIPADEWEQYRLTCGTDNPDFNIVKNNDSTFSVYPKYKDGKREDTATGDIEFNITVSASNDHRVTDSGTVKAKINIYDDISAVQLGIAISDQSEKCDNKNFASQYSDRVVTITWQGQNLTREQYDALSLTVDVDDPDYTAEIKLNPYVEGEPTTATVKFALVNDENGEAPLPKYLHGNKSFTVRGTIDREGQISEGTATSKLKVDDARTLWEKLQDWLPILIALVILLFLFLGYAPIIKKYLPKNSYYSDDFGSKYYISWYKNSKAIATVLVPFCPVKSSADLTATNPPLKLVVTASGGKNAWCENASSICDQGLLINGSSTKSRKRVNLHRMTITTTANTEVTTLSKN